MAKRYRFGFRRLDVYRAAVEHFEWTCGVVRRMPKGPFVVVNQAVGASLSVMGNIGEAHGRETRLGEIEQHCRYAQGSAFEAATHLDALAALGVIDDAEYNAAENRLARIAMMLTRLMQKQRRRKRGIRAVKPHRVREGPGRKGSPPAEVGSRVGGSASTGGSFREGGLVRGGRPHGKAGVPLAGLPEPVPPPSNPREARPAGLAAAGRFDPPPGVAARAKRAPATESPHRGAAEGGSNPDAGRHP